MKSSTAADDVEQLHVGLAFRKPELRRSRLDQPARPAFRFQKRAHNLDAPFSLAPGRLRDVRQVRHGHSICDALQPALTIYRIPQRPLTGIEEECDRRPGRFSSQISGRH
jgi:hypothetical protein